MYEAFYGLTSKPFLLSPDPNFYFGSKQHSRARAYLEYGISCNEGFVIVTGEIGAGKTTILRTLIEGMHGSNVIIGQLVTTQLDAEDTLRMVGAAFGFNVKGIPKSELLIALEAFLLSKVSKGQHCLLIVDEAQNLTMRAVEELRMLSNFQFGNKALLQSFLIGQPEFREILRRPEMEQFRQRVAATCHIGPLNGDETRGYIQHRLKCAGSTGAPSFDDQAFVAIYEASGGIPRRINSICDRLLLLGFLNSRTHLSVEDVAEVVKDFATETTIDIELDVGGERGEANALRSAPRHNGHDVMADLSRIGLDPELAGRLTRHLTALVAEQGQAQLQRVEASMLRVERLSQNTLATLLKLVSAVKTPPAQDENPS
ncbi:MAG: XrtA/PEP-CTERM system-associated ATPase [Vitreoscilla sp.]